MEIKTELLVVSTQVKTSRLLCQVFSVSLPLARWFPAYGSSNLQCGLSTVWDHHTHVQTSKNYYTHKTFGSRHDRGTHNIHIHSVACVYWIRSPHTHVPIRKPYKTLPISSLLCVFLWGRLRWNMRERGRHMVKSPSRPLNTGFQTPSVLQVQPIESLRKTLK